MPYDAMKSSLRPYLGRLSLAQTGAVLAAILAAPDDTKGVLTPEHVLVTTDGRVEIVDVVGVSAPAYMAPEHPLGGDLGPWTDLYSVGCLAFALLTGDPPFGEDGSPVALLLRQVNEPPPRVPHVDPRLAEWVERLLAKNPAERPQSAGEAWDELETILLALLGPSWRNDAALPPRRPTGVLDAAPPAAANPQESVPTGHIPAASHAAAPGPRPAATPHLTAGAPAAATPGTPGGPAAPGTPAAATHHPAPRTPAAATPRGAPDSPAAAPHPAPGRPSSPRRARRRRGAAVPAAVAGGLAAIAVAAGALAADGPANRAPAPRTILHTAGVAVELPAGWRVIATGKPAVPGIDDGLTARGARGATVVIGAADRTAFNRSLLPTGLRAGSAATPGARSLRYRRTIAGRAAEIHSLATAKGVTLLVCFDRPRPCAAIADTLRGELRSLGPDRRFGAHAARILTWLEAKERSLVPKLQSPSTRTAATKRLWWAYLRAAKNLRGLAVQPADRELRRQLAEAVRLAGCAYGRAAGHPERIAREQRTVQTEQANAAKALSNLAEAGYELPAGAATFTRIS